MNRQFTDAAALAGHLVLPGSMFAFLAAHRAEVFPGCGLRGPVRRAGRGVALQNYRMPFDLGFMRSANAAR